MILVAKGIARTARSGPVIIETGEAVSVIFHCAVSERLRTNNTLVSQHESQEGSKRNEQRPTGDHVELESQPGEHSSADCNTKACIADQYKSTLHHCQLRVPMSKPTRVFTERIHSAHSITAVQMQVAGRPRNRSSRGYLSQRLRVDLAGLAWGGWWDLNPRHPEPQSGATTN